MCSLAFISRSAPPKTVAHEESQIHMTQGEQTG